MVVEYIRYTIDSERAQVFEQAYRRAAVALDASEHCVRYEVSRCSDDATQYVVRIDWDSEEGHLSGFAGARGSAASSRRSARSCTTSMRCAITRSRSQATE